MLQQILFFRELGFPLSNIEQIISSDDFNKIEALNTHKSLLQSTLERTNTLIQTIDKTMSHLRGKLIMPEGEMFDGFNPNKQQEHEQYMVNTGILTQEQVEDSWGKVRHWNKDNWDQFKQEGEQLNQELAKALSKHLKPADNEVQDLIQKHYSWVSNFWVPTKNSYIGLAQMYKDHPDYKYFYNRYHPNLVEFVVEAMGIYSDRALS